MIEHVHKCRLVIEGFPPGILLNNPVESMGRSRTCKKVIPKPEDEAARSCYWTEDRSSLAWPALNFLKALVEAATGFKSPINKKMALGPIVAGDVQVNPEMIPFNTTEYQIDTRRVVVGKAGVLRSRARLYPWRMEMIVSWEAQYLSEDFHEIVLPELLIRLGHTVGIGDFRPGKSKGPFGRFGVVSIEKI